MTTCPHCHAELTTPAILAEAFPLPVDTTPEANHAND